MTTTGGSRSAPSAAHPPPSMALGRRGDGSVLSVSCEQAVLVIGPPRSGKTRNVVIPAVLGAAGPVVSTSTKVDVLAATAGARRERGRVWLFDPAGAQECPPGVTQLRWSPVRAARTWDGALLMTRAMVDAAPAARGTMNEGFWTQRAQTMLAPLLHAAAIANRGIGEVVSWVMAHDLVTPSELLHSAGAEWAELSLVGIARSDARERASVFAVVDGILAAYHGDAARGAAVAPNFDVAQFVASPGDSVFVTAAAHQQQLVAPLVVGLLEEIRHATYAADRAGQDVRVLLALDEVANIAPIHDLPALVSEAGGQGLQVLACVQDLSQVRARWSAEIADGFLTLFGVKVVFPGVCDPATLTGLSVAAGETQTWAKSQTTNNASTGEARSTTWNQQWRPTYAPGEIAGLAKGMALVMEGARPTIVALGQMADGAPPGAGPPFNHDSPV
jgi:type IV secretion system protein VirD4